MTQTHILAGTSAFARPGETLRNVSVLLGSFLPDAAIYALFTWSKAAGIPERRVWDEIYWQEPWRDLTAVGNSVFVWLGLLVAGILVLRTRVAFRVGLALFFVSVAALLHVALDFPVHHDDAHRHLWPFSDWVFRSPVSYWDPAHHGRIFIWIEGTLGLILAVVLWRRFPAAWVRAILLLLIVAYAAVPAYFTFMLGDGA